jgi:hypothetical protein
VNKKKQKNFDFLLGRGQCHTGPKGNGSFLVFFKRLFFLPKSNAWLAGPGPVMTFLGAILTLCYKTLHVEHRDVF